MRLSMSEKKGIISAMTHAATQVSAMMPAQADQPITVFECRCLEPRKSLKNTKRADTDYAIISTGAKCMLVSDVSREGRTEYNAPRYTIVGTAKLKAIFLNVGVRDPNAGAVIYSFPKRV